MDYQIRYRKGGHWTVEFHQFGPSMQLRGCHLVICGYEVEVSSYGGPWVPFIPAD